MRTPADELRSHIDFIATIGKKELPAGYVYRSVGEFLLKHGTDFSPATDQTPGHLVDIAMKGCFDNAYRLARRRPSKFRYVEGYALNYIPLEHAWVVNEHGEVLDPTWDEHSTIGSAYCGVVIPLKRMVKVRRNRHCITALFNWEKGFPLLRERYVETIS